MLNKSFTNVIFRDNVISLSFKMSQLSLTLTNKKYNSTLLTINFSCIDFTNELKRNFLNFIDD